MDTDRASAGMRLRRGFVATMAVTMLGLGAGAYELVVMAAVRDYADLVDRREWRIQADFNLSACLDVVAMRFRGDYFLADTVAEPTFGCVASVSNDGGGHIRVAATSTFGALTRSGSVFITF